MRRSAVHGNLGKQAAGAPEHLARLRFHENLARFKRGLDVAKQCGRLAQACQSMRDSYGRYWTTCTWRASGKIVAASANPGAKQDLRKAGLWTDKDLLRGRCPR